MRKYYQQGTNEAELDRRLKRLELPTQPMKMGEVSTLPAAANWKNHIVVHSGAVKWSDGTTWNTL